MLQQNQNTTSQSTSTPIPAVKSQKELPKRSKLPLILSLIFIVIIGLAGIGISLRQYFIRESVSPTAPSQSQANIDKVQDCSVGFDVAPPASGISCVKQAYQNELSNTDGSYEMIQTQSNFTPGDVVVYNLTITNDGSEEASITATDTINISDQTTFYFLDSNCGANAYLNNTLTCTTDLLLPGESQSFSFRIKLSEDITTDMTLTNNAQITDGTLSQSCVTDILIESVTEANCNETCSSNSECIGDKQICYQGLCRLEEYPEIETCEVIMTPTPTPTPDLTLESSGYCNEYCSTNIDCVQEDQICYFNQCRLAEYPERNDCSIPVEVMTTTFIEPTPTVGCNEDCITNKDCSNDDQICYEGACRLANYPASTSCTVPTASGDQSQPKMPDELPLSGSDDLINWIKAGIGILGAGALLLLL